VESRTLSEIVGAQVFLKFENLQFTSSFKERGACNKLVDLSESGTRGVIAMSAATMRRVWPITRSGSACAR
jgi:threonine dehydratase